MSTSNKIHLTILSLINLILVCLMIHAAWKGNDKAILIIVLLYPILTLFNATIWFILFVYQQSVSRFHRWNTIGLIAFFIPALIVASMY